MICSALSTSFKISFSIPLAMIPWIYLKSYVTSCIGIICSDINTDISNRSSLALNHPANPPFSKTLSAVISCLEAAASLLADLSSFNLSTFPVKDQTSQKLTKYMSPTHLRALVGKMNGLNSITFLDANSKTSMMSGEKSKMKRRALQATIRESTGSP